MLVPTNMGTQQKHLSSSFAVDRKENLLPWSSILLLEQELFS